MKRQLPKDADALLRTLLRSGDGAQVRLGYEASEMVAAMVEQNLVEVELLGGTLAVRLKRNDRSRAVGG